MLLDFMSVGFGLALLIAGGDLMVRGASALARQVGVSPLAIGLTVVAFGTSAPELAVNVTAAWTGRGEVSFGNVIGSNMANIGLIVALAALIRPLQIKSTVISREVPMMILATAVTCALGLDAILSRDGASSFDRGDGLALLLLFTVFIYYTINDVIVQRQNAAETQDLEEFRLAEPGPGSTRSLVYVASGLVGLVIGAQITVDGAVSLARDFGVSEAIIGLTVIAIGTSLPEMSASLVASWKGHSDIAIGNVVGSNIFNLLLVLGVSATIRPIDVPAGGVVDLAVVAGLSLLLWVTSMSLGNRIIRTEAVLLLAVYLAYISYRSLAWVP